MTAHHSTDIASAREHLKEHGYAVIPNLIGRDTITDLKARVDRLLAHEREHPFDPGDGPSLPSDDGYCSEYGPFVADHLIREALHPYPDDLVIATKVGFTRQGPGRWVPVGRPEYLRQQVTVDSHSPGRFRAIAAPMNSPEFHRAFRCEAGDKMIAEPPCTVW